ncbi:MAG: alkaline phosphatase family protein [Deltaproteobacteria bacterium]|nr:alkaline phosphatase family protein [Deltaproteobacteria bacterium]
MGLFDRFRKPKAKPRVAVIGLDGVGTPLIEALTDRGVMPRMAALRRAGTLTRMTSSIPTISSVSWSSFMTGTNPGRHGIYGFTDVKRDSYALYFPNYRHVQGATIWDVLGSFGRRSIVLNIPNTYPAKDINGVLVSGFVAVNIERAVTPASVLPLLKSQGYKIDVDYVNANDRVDAFFRDLHDTLAARRRTLAHFLREENWDCFIGVITETDRLHHYFWSAYADPAAPLHQRFLDFYAAVDAAIGELVDALPDGTPLFVLADHGHTLIETEFYPNVWLRREGLLTFKTPTPKSIADLDPTSKAFILDPGRIYLNLKGRFANGVVEPGAEAEELLRRITDGLAAIEYPGPAVHGVRRPVKQVFRRDEIYHGPQVAQAPDAVLHFHDGFDIKGAVARDEIFGRSALTGMHTYDDSLLYVNRPGFAARDAAIADLAPTILALLDTRPAEPMDGRVLDA